MGFPSKPLNIVSAIALPSIGLLTSTASKPTTPLEKAQDRLCGIINDPNSVDDPEYIVCLIKQVVMVRVETVKIVKGLPALKTK